MQEVRHDGEKGPLVPFEEKGMKALLAEKDVHHVEVYHLHEGLELVIGRTRYRVQRTRSNGTVIMKRTGEIDT